MKKSRVSDKTSSAEKFTAIGFVVIAFAAVFISIHKKDIVEGRFIETMASYIES